MSFGIFRQPIQQPLRFNGFYRKENTPPTKTELDAICRKDGVKTSDIFQHNRVEGGVRAYYAATGDEKDLLVENQECYALDFFLNRPNPAPEAFPLARRTSIKQPGLDRISDGSSGDEKK